MSKMQVGCAGCCMDRGTEGERTERMSKMQVGSVGCCIDRGTEGEMTERMSKMQVGCAGCCIEGGTEGERTERMSKMQVGSAGCCVNRWTEGGRSGWTDGRSVVSITWPERGLRRWVKCKLEVMCTVRMDGELSVYLRRMMNWKEWRLDGESFGSHW
jgi:hypothetical protein